MVDGIRHLAIAAFLPPGGWVHPARIHYPAGRRMGLHDHDFTEVFWIERGSALHLTRSGERRLGPGDCLFVAPELAHGFAAVDRAGFSMVNIAFPVAILAFARERWGGTTWPWGEGQTPIRLDPPAVSRLSGWLSDLRLGAPRLDAEAFVSDLLRLVAHHDATAAAGLPQELHAALAGLAGEDLPLELDPPWLARECGWSVTHLNRVVRRATGGTTTALLNRLRLERAERLLRLDHRAVTAIALSAGFPTLGHFYRVFTAAHGCTPRAWRERQQSTAG